MTERAQIYRSPTRQMRRIAAGTKAGASTVYVVLLDDDVLIGVGTARARLSLDELALLIADLAGAFGAEIDLASLVGAPK